MMTMRVICGFNVCVLKANAVGDGRAEPVAFSHINDIKWEPVNDFP